MLMLVAATDTAQDVAARFAEHELTVAEIAAAPVRFAPPSFLAAVAGLFPDLLETDVAQLAAL